MLSIMIKSDLYPLPRTFCKLDQATLRCRMRLDQVLNEVWSRALMCKTRDLKGGEVIASIIKPDLDTLASIAFVLTVSMERQNTRQPTLIKKLVCYD
jgi:hypothetical protein